MRKDSGNLGDVFVADSDSDRIAIIDLRLPSKPKEISYRSLNNAVDALARGLIKEDLGRETGWVFFR